MTARTLRNLFGIAVILGAIAGPASAAPAATTDQSPHKVTFVSVEKGIKLEVLDWGGTGRPLVFLAGLGDTAHAFDQLAPEFTKSNHVFGITRRGFGNSNKPQPTAENYSTPRLGKDVLAAIDALELHRPILVGHSLAGEELSWVGSYHPDKVAGLIYLDAGYSYAYYAPGSSIPLGTNLLLSAEALNSEMRKLQAPGVVGRDRPIANIATDIRGPLSDFEKDLAAAQHALEIFPPPSSGPERQPKSLQERISAAVLSGAEKFTQLHVPILALFGDPPAGPPNVDP
ncbi:MAG: alpha/beta fold hydrolase, partial [Candidatus Dormibacteraceae bacterium]